MLPAGTSLAYLRLGAGAGALLAPGLMHKAFGGDFAANEQSGLWARMFATRELALAGAVLAGGPGARAYAIKAGIGVDAGDALAAVLERRAGRVSGMTNKLVLGVALGAVAAGVLALSE